MTSATFNKLFHASALVLFTLEVFSAGSSFAQNHVAEGAIALALAGLWGSVLLMEWYVRAQDSKHLRALEEFLIKFMKDVSKFQKDIEEKTAPKPATKKPATPKKAPAKKASKK